MLSEHTTAVVKSTAPVLAERGTDITSCFYKRMFAAHPELLNIFNHANQKQGRQQAALANAVYAAAANIDRLPAILPVVRQIAHKHRSLGVKAEHYPIVGRHLLEAIREVLGEAATDEIMNAWREAYGVIADAFIRVEADMYAETERQPGGWEGFRAFTVARKEKESDVITSFYLAPEDGGPIADFKPGQYVSVKVNVPGEDYTHIRQYSLSDAPGGGYYRISVKREDGGGGRPPGKVSVYLHERVNEGDALLLSAPAGDFVLDERDERPVVLISGGVGLTPMVSMLNALVRTAPHRPVTFIHAAQDGGRHAMKAHAAELARRHPQVTAAFCYSRPSERDRQAGDFHKEGYIDLPWLQSVVADPNAAYYFCGPMPFMRAVRRLLGELAVPERDIRYEFFGPSGNLATD